MVLLYYIFNKPKLNITLILAKPSFYIFVFLFRHDHWPLHWPTQIQRPECQESSSSTIGYFRQIWFGWHDWFLFKQLKDHHIFRPTVGTFWNILSICHVKRTLVIDDLLYGPFHLRMYLENYLVIYILKYLSMWVGSESCR